MNSAKIVSPIDRHELLNTNSSDKALELMRAFGARSLEPTAGNKFSFKVNVVRLTDVVLTHGVYGADTFSAYETKEYFWQTFAITGKARQCSPGLERRLDLKNWSALFEPEIIATATTSENYQQLTVKIKTETVQRMLSSLIGRDVGVPRFQATTNHRNPRLQSMRRAVFSLACELNGIARKYTDVVLKEIEQEIVLSLLLGHSHDQSSLLFEEPSAPSSRQLLLIEEYIAANWDSPLDIQLLSQLADVSVRSIYRYFRELRGCSPSQFLKEIRLEKAHQELLNPNMGTTVVATAFGAGFNGLGHFARSYKEKYGEYPSDTLKRRRSAE